MKKIGIDKIQEIHFWIIIVVISIIGFVYSIPSLSIETVPVTFPRETVFFTLSFLAICFSTLRGGSPLAGDKRISFYLLIAFMIWSIIASLWAANIEGHSRRLVELVFFCGWALALSSLAVPVKKIELLTMWMGFMGGVIGIAVAGGKYAFGSGFGTWPFGNANAAGMFCAFAVVINSGLFLKKLRKHDFKNPMVIIPLACAIMAFIGLYFARSKGAFLGFIVGETVLGLRFFSQYKKWIAISAGLVLFLGVVGYLFTTNWDIEGTTSGFRIKAYKAALGQIGDAPVGGTGLGSFYAYFPKHSLPGLSGHPKMGDTVFHAHSNILEIGTELGIVGMAIFLAFLVFLGILPILKKNTHEDTRSRLESIWLAGFLAIATHALFAVHFYWTETVLYFWTSAGVLLALGRREVLGIKLDKRIPALAVVFISLVGIWYVGVYQEYVGRTHIYNREKTLKMARKLDKDFESMGRQGMSKTPKFQSIRKKRIQLYSSIISDLNEELAYVHVQRMRSDTYYQLGSAYFNLGFPREALYFFKKIVEDAPGYVNTDYFLGRSYDAIRRKENRLHNTEKLQQYHALAIESLKRYLASNVRAKMSGEATVFLANLYVQRNQLTEAIQTIEEHLKYKPESDRKTELIRLRNSIVAKLGAKNKRTKR